MARTGYGRDRSTNDDADSGRLRAWEQEASTEAAAHPPDDAGKRCIASALTDARRRLGGEDVKGHCVSFDARKWKLDGQCIPRELLLSGEVSRGDIFAAAALADPGFSWRIFCLSFIWGHGGRGYGRARFDRIIEATPRAILVDRADAALGRLRHRGPVGAYDFLRASGTRCAVPHWGPAFFTKFLYFADNASGLPRALILDQTLALAVTDLGRMDYFVNRHGKALRWTAYRYGVYLAWMNQTAAHFQVRPDFLEYALYIQRRK